MCSIKNEIQIINEVVKYENAYGRLFDDEVLFTSSNIVGNYVRWQWKPPYSVAVLPITSNQEIILINNFRHSARKNVIEVPKGFGREGLDPVEIVKEELLQETGVTSSSFEYLGEVVTDAAFAYHPMHLYIARNCEIGTSAPEDREAINGIEFIPAQKLGEYLTEGTIEDAVTLLLLTMFINKKD